MSASAWLLCLLSVCLSICVYGRDSDSQNTTQHLTRVSSGKSSDGDLDIELLLVGKPLIGVVEEGESRLVHFGVLPKGSKFPDVMLYLEAVDEHAEVDIFCMPYHRMSENALPDRVNAIWKSTEQGEVFISSKGIAYQEAVDSRMRSGEMVKIAKFGCAIRGMSGGSSNFQLTVRLSFDEREIHPRHERALREIHKACCEENECHRWSRNELTTEMTDEDDAVEFDFCHRTGSICNSKGYLLRLDLRSYGLKCQLPVKALLKLTTLEALDLSDNSIHADVSDDVRQLGNLKYLKDLSMEHNLIVGQLSSTDCSKLLSNLHMLNLDRNYISGELPSCLFSKNQSLEEIYLSLNIFTGQIPDVFPSSSPLKALTLSGNSLTGELPPSLGNLGKLKALYLDGNSFSGPIPDEVVGLESLEVLDLSNNELARLPQSWMTSWKPPRCLRIIKLRNNRIHGLLPKRLLRAEALEWLDLSKNSFSGQLFSKRGMFPSLMHFNISRNQLTGPIPDQFSSMGLFGNEQRSGPQHVFDVSYNNLTGAIPAFMYQEKNPSIIETDIYLEGNIFTCHPWRTLNYIPNFECSNSGTSREVDGPPPEFFDSEKNQRDLISSIGGEQTVQTNSVDEEDIDGSWASSGDDEEADVVVGVVSALLGVVLLVGITVLIVKFKRQRERRLGLRYGPAEDIASDDGIEADNEDEERRRKHAESEMDKADQEAEP